MFRSTWCLGIFIGCEIIFDSGWGSDDPRLKSRKISFNHSSVCCHSWPGFSSRHDSKAVLYPLSPTFTYLTVVLLITVSAAWTFYVLRYRGSEQRKSTFACNRPHFDLTYCAVVLVLRKKVLHTMGTRINSKNHGYQKEKNQNSNFMEIAKKSERVEIGSSLAHSAIPLVLLYIASTTI